MMNEQKPCEVQEQIQKLKVGSLEIVDQSSLSLGTARSILDSILDCDCSDLEQTFTVERERTLNLLWALLNYITEAEENIEGWWKKQRAELQA